MLSIWAVYNDVENRPKSTTELLCGDRVKLRARVLFVEVRGGWSGLAPLGVETKDPLEKYFSAGRIKQPFSVYTVHVDTFKEDERITRRSTHRTLEVFGEWGDKVLAFAFRTQDLQVIYM